MLNLMSADKLRAELLALPAEERPNLRTLCLRACIKKSMQKLTMHG
jgi:hypothetical protein